MMSPSVFATGVAIWLSIHRAGLESVELIDRFPVLTGHFGYTRGDHEPGRHGRGHGDARTRQQVVHGDLQQTEALFVRLEPLQVRSWLANRGHGIDTANDAK